MDKDIIYYVNGTKGKTTSPFFQAKGPTQGKSIVNSKFSDLQKCKGIVLNNPKGDL